MNRKVYTGVLILLLFITGRASAFHMVGGDISMVHLGSPGYFRLTVNQYWDEVAISKNASASYEINLTVYVFSLRTRQLMDQFLLQRSNKQPLNYRNEACAVSAGLRTSQVQYTTDAQFDVGEYTDSQGYYLVWERCCRNASIDNIIVPDQMGQVFYLEFPAMSQSGQLITNSSPEFSIPNGEYACRNRPFTLDFGAVDKDGDVLSYQLITPWAGYTSSGAGQTIGTGTSYPFYPTIIWKPGYSSQLTIPGPSPLKIGAGTGQISVTAGQQGLFAFSIEVTEYRNGQPIGKVHRDFQLLVVDCSVAVPPPAVVNFMGQPAKTVEFCAGNSAQLTVDSSPNWAYQWQKDGENITGATSATLVVQETGNYTVVRSLAQTCSRDTASSTVVVTEKAGAAVTITPSPSLTICEGSVVSLQAQPTSGTYQWFVDGQASAMLPPQSLISVQKSGMYTVQYTATGSTCPGRDSVAVIVKPLPTAVVSGKQLLCGTDTSRLTTPAIADARYSWTRDAVPYAGTSSTIAANQGGTYRATVTNAYNCAATSAPFLITQVPNTVIKFDSLSPICDTHSGPVSLSAQPSGGIFNGVGVTGSSFDPSLSGAGRFAITYRYTDASGCQNASQRIINVQDAIDLTVPSTITLFGGDSARILATVSVPVASVNWSPASGLNSTSKLQPTTTTRESITYSIQVQTLLGCTASGNVHVDVIERLLLPTAFTPNGDGHNDRWEIHGLMSFEAVEVFIYDRWGSVIYHSTGYDQPWDGTFRGARVEPGDYVYRILTSNELIHYTGHVLVLY